MFVCQEMVMGLISRLRIGARLALGFGLMLLLITVLIVTSHQALQRIGRENRALMDEEMTKVAAIRARFSRPIRCSA